MVWEYLALWQKITLYVFLLVGLFIYVKTSKLRVHERVLIPLPYRIGLALFFPVLIALLFFFGVIVLGIAALAITAFLITALITKKKMKMPGVRIIIRRGLPK